MHRLSKIDLSVMPTTYEIVLQLVDTLIQKASLKVKCNKETCLENCCRSKLTITRIEYEYLRSHIKQSQTENKDLCPLLIGGLCSVYTFRPVECRLYNSIDSIVGVGCGNPTKLEDFYVAVREMVYRLLWYVNKSTEERTIEVWMLEYND